MQPHADRALPKGICKDVAFLTSSITVPGTVVKPLIALTTTLGALSTGALEIIQANVTVKKSK